VEQGIAANEFKIAPMETGRPLLPFTGNDDADRLLETDPNALLYGFLLDQQVTLQKAFYGPFELKQRIGTLDPGKIAGMDPAKLETVFRTPPALHRFPANMAHRTQELAAAIARDYDGDASKIWRDAKSGRELEQRLLALPGIGEMKAKTLIAIIGKRFGVKPAGWDDVAPHHPTLADVDSPDTLAEYQAGKRAKKAAMRAASQK